MLEFLTGRKIRLFDTSELAARMDGTASTANQALPNTPPPPAGYGVESYSETEQTSFTASGTVKTADGRQISFKLELSMSRTYHEESNVSLRMGDAARKSDPLMLNFSGNAAALTDQRFAFDLNPDGKTANINFVAPGSGFLVFDRNQDGKINNGSEMFGPTNGDGFAEQTKLADDNNGWIDENDAVFSQLQIWSRDSSGQDQRQSVAAAGVGAIALCRISTPFELTNNDNQTLVKIFTSVIF